MGRFSVSINESGNTIQHLYFLSKDNMDNKTLYPRIPDNYFTKNDYEDSTTKRVCFAHSINKALMGISMRMKGMELYVHIPKDSNIKTHKPNSKEVPDVKITGETWVTEPVKIKCIGKIRVIDDAGKDGHPFKYGNNTAELYDWNWEWIEKYKEGINEGMVISEKDFSNNLEKWENDKYPVLLITGLSGGGKSTLASQLATQHKADIVELDGLEWNFDNSRNHFLTKFINENPQYKKSIQDHWKDEKGKIPAKKFIYFCISHALKNNIKIIIEGVQIYYVMIGSKEDLIYMTDKPIIIKGTSPIISKLRQFKRIINGGEEGQPLSTLIKDNNYLTDFRNKIKSTIKENEESDNMGILFPFAENVLNLKKIDINYSDKFSDVTDIVNSLSKDEKYELAPSDFSKPNGHFTNSRNCVYRKVYKNGKENMGFIELYIFDDKTKAYTAVAIKPKYRGKSLTKLMVDEAIDSISNKKGLKKIMWGAIKKNIPSNKLAKDMNFNLCDSDDVDNIYELKLNKKDKSIEEAYLIESSIYKKKYSCPYCDNKLDRQKLVKHVDENHEDFIPENYTATRIIFNLVNKKEKGTCVICGKETQWDENKAKYDRFCCEKCVQEYIKQRNESMMRTHGKLYVTDDPEFQKKMLSNRSISGDYLWSDGVKRSYTGSYEKKLLEFLDKVMGFKSCDVITPGTTVYYIDDDGKQRAWILDDEITPYNLQIDVKDGGDNPNNKEMPEYRAKQIAKEKSIYDQKKYNYLRLTNNNFGQLINTLAQIKQNLLENNEDKIWNINEYMAMGSCNPIVSGSAEGNNVIQQRPIKYIVPAMVQNTFVEPLYSRDEFLEKLYRIQDGKLVLTNKKDISKEFDISNKLLKSSQAEDMQEDLEQLLTKESYVDHNIMYELMTGHKLLDKNQYFFDENLEIELEGFYKSKLRKEIIESTFSNLLNKYKIIISENMHKISYKNLSIERDKNGYYAYNEFTRKRTKSYQLINEISDDILEILNNDDFLNNTNEDDSLMN